MRISFNRIDEDGFDIQNLLLTMFHRLCPELITNGHIYIVETALFKAVFKDDTHKLFYTKADFDAWNKKNKKPYHLERNKGLGSLSQDDAYEQLVNRETRRLLKVSVEDYEEFKSYIRMFRGNKEVEERREFLSENYLREWEDIYE